MVTYSKMALSSSRMKSTARALKQMLIASLPRNQTKRGMVIVTTACPSTKHTQHAQPLSERASNEDTTTDD